MNNERAELAIDSTDHAYAVCPDCNAMMELTKCWQGKYNSDCPQRPRGYFEVIMLFKCHKCGSADKRKFPSTCRPNTDIYIRSKTRWDDDLNLKIQNPLDSIGGGHGK